MGSMAHRKLDEAVISAYAAVDPKGGWDVQWAEAYVEYGAGELPAPAPGKGERGKKAKGNGETKRRREEAELERVRELRREVDEKVLGALLGLNLRRSASSEGGR